MKTLLLYVAGLIIFSTNLHAQTRSAKDLLGKWAGTDNTGAFGSIEFLDEKKVKLVSEDGKIIVTTYKANFSKDPVWLDIENTPGGDVLLVGWIVFVTDNTIRWQVFDDGVRKGKMPVKDNSSTITLRRSSN